MSGGLDSAVLWSVLKELEGALKWDIVLLHVHHGDDPAPEQVLFRNSAQRRVAAWGRESKWDVQVFQHQGEVLKSEDDCRKVRRDALFKFHKELHLDFVLTAHHQQDLLETRLIHLIRGCGGEGLKSLKLQSEIFLRPLLGVAKVELRDYARARQLAYEEDPTNLDLSHSLRNWIRLKWLPELEKQRPGAVKTMAASLEKVAQDLNLMQRDNDELGVVGPGEWSRPSLLALPESRRVQALVVGLQRISDLEFTQGQVLEAIKRLDNPQNEYKFSLSGMVWDVTTSKVKVTKIEP